MTPSARLSRQRRALLITLLIGAVGVGLGCTQKAADATKQGVDQALDATKAGANKAIDATKAAGDKTAEALQKSAETSKEVAATTSAVVTDGWVTGKLKVKFADEKSLKGSAIDVDTRRGVVTLKGTVLSAAGKSRAEELAVGTEGVTGVVNQLVVK